MQTDDSSEAHGNASKEPVPRFDTRIRRAASRPGSDSLDAARLASRLGREGDRCAERARGRVDRACCDQCRGRRCRRRAGVAPGQARFGRRHRTALACHRRWVECAHRPATRGGPGWRRDPGRSPVRRAGFTRRPPHQERPRRRRNPPAAPRRHRQWAHAWHDQWLGARDPAVEPRPVATAFPVTVPSLGSGHEPRSAREHRQPEPERKPQPDGPSRAQPRQRRPGSA
jgi:hypothetical protein